MDIAKRITELREEAGENRKEFSIHTGTCPDIGGLGGGAAYPAGIYTSVA